MKRILLLVVLAVCLNNLVIAQSQKDKQFTSENGLLTDKIYNLHQDRDGFLWVFSEFGTLKYNGEKFTKVLKNLPLTESSIYCIYENRDGRKWIANSNAHIYEIVNDSAKKLNGFEETSSLLKKTVSEIVKIVVDDQQNVYIATKRYSYKLHNNNGNYKAEDLSQQVTGDSTRLKLFQINNELFLVFKRSENDEFNSANVIKQRYLQFDGTSRRIKLIYESYTEPYRHFRAFGDRIYYTKADKLGRINSDNTVTEVSFHFPVLNFRRDANNHIWVGCVNGGLFELDENDSIIAKYLDGITVNDICIDFQNGVWASTAGFGLHRFANNDLPEIKPVIQNSALLFAESGDGAMLLANSKGELFYKNSSGLSQLALDAKDELVSALIQGNKIYLGLSHSLELLTRSGKNFTESIYTYKCPKYLKLYSLSSDTILGVWRRGFSFITGGYAYKYIDFGEKIICSSMYKDTIWFGTEYGLHYRPLIIGKKSKRIGFEVMPDKEQAQTVASLQKFLSGSISALEVDSLGRKWFAIKSEGLFCLIGATVKTIVTPKAEVIHSIDATSKSLLLATNRGAFFAELNAEGEVSKWIKIHSAEIQKSLRFGKNLYLQTHSSLVRVHSVTTEDESNRLMFRYVGVLEDSIRLKHKQTFKARHNMGVLNFEFERITYQEAPPDLLYSLTGPINQTGRSTTSELQFSRLEPGKYELKVYPDIVQGEKLTVIIPFEIVPEWYETWWAILFFICLALAILILLAAYYFKRNRNLLQQKNEQEQLLLEYKLIALKAQVNPHFISNCLTAIQNLISKGKSDTANMYVARFGLLVRKILDYSSKSLIPLSEELEVVQLYLHMEEIRYGKNFDFKIEFDANIKPEDILVPPLLLNPIIENAIWHGLLPLDSTEAPVLRIHVASIGEALIIEITDNGVGLSKAKKVEDSRKSYGLDITEQRIRNINYLLNSTVGKVEISDRQFEDQSQRGVIVRVRLPLENKYE